MESVLEGAALVLLVLFSVVATLIWFAWLAFFIGAAGACISCLWEPADTGIRPLGRAVNTCLSLLWIAAAVSWVVGPAQVIAG